MSDGYHGSMPSAVFKDLILGANPTSHDITFEVSRMNAYVNAGLYKGGEHIMGVTIGELPEHTVLGKEGAIEALGWRETLTTLISDHIIEPNESIKMWLGVDGTAYALAKRKPQGIIATI
jgi:hypothetical protein